MAEKKRIQFDMNPKHVEDLDKMTEQFGFSSRKETVNTALSILRWMGRMLSDGQVIVALNEETKSFRELSMPCFDNVKRETNER